jgi:hypothetical protein
MRLLASAARSLARLSVLAAIFWAAIAKELRSRSARSSSPIPPPVRDEAGSTSATREPSGPDPINARLDPVAGFEVLLRTRFDPELRSWVLIAFVLEPSTGEHWEIRWSRTECDFPSWPSHLPQSVRDAATARCVQSEARRMGVDA